MRPTLFLSYASEDRAAARSIRDAVSAAGIEVWYDENELGGGDAWDKKIRQQIRDCDYFMAVISARTEARHEGYFRREWRIAVERSLDMADDHLFLLPVVIDNTAQAAARVPEKFLTVQWIKVPDGQPTPALSALCTRLISGGAPETPAPRRTPPRVGKGRAEPAPVTIPAFPIEEPGQRVKFWFHVVGWLFVSARIQLKRLPRSVRLLIYIWLFLFLLEKGCSRDHTVVTPISPAATLKLKEIAEKYQGSSNKADIAKLGADIAREFTKDDDDDSKDSNALLAIPFIAPADNSAEAKLADSAFALVYGRLSISHQGKVGLSKVPLPSLETEGVVERGRESHSRYIVCGAIENRSGSRVLTVDIIKVSDSSEIWSKDYPVATADPATIALETEAKVPSLDDQ